MQRMEDLPDWAQNLLETARVAHLGLTDDAGRPRVLPITFALTRTAIASVVDDKPKRRPGAELARVRWLRARPAAAFTVDRYADDWSELAWVQVLGEVALAEPADHPDALDALRRKYEPYRERAPRGPLLLLRPERAIHWRAGT
jgi:PPOX class probable F420-dependent enzyme